jgi:hypothetical protein
MKGERIPRKQIFPVVCHGFAMKILYLVHG